MHLDEHSCSSLCGSVCRVVNCCCGLSGAWVAVSKGTAVVWVLDTALVTISGVFAAAVAAVVPSSVVLAQSGSGLDKVGWGHCWGAGVQPGSQCHHSGGPGGGSEAEGEWVVVVNNVGIIDGSYAGVVSGDMAALRGVLGCLTKVCVAISIVLDLVWVLKSTHMFFSAVGSSLSGSSVCRVAQLYSGTGLVCMAISMVVVVVWVSMVHGLAFFCVPFHCLHSSTIPPLYASSSLSSTSSPHCW